MVDTGYTGDNDTGNEGTVAQAQPTGVLEQTGPPPRVPRTHKPNLIDVLKGLSFTNKLIRNKSIEAKNAARELKSLDHQTDPVTHPVLGSETASLITIEEDDLNRLKVPSFFSTVSQHVYASLAKWLVDQELADKKAMLKVKRKADDKSTSEETRINKRRCMDGSLLVLRAKGRPTPLEHPQILYDTEAHTMTC